jgi:hypothetical protein
MTEVITETEHIFQIGDRVERIEDRPIVAATVISINEDPIVPQLVEISYDEGGSGWWYSSALRPLA